MGKVDAGCDLSFVMPGLVPGIDVFARKSWMAGT
jgi:hypothetical protein